MSERNELLNQLKIDRSDSEASGGISKGATAVMVLAAAVLGAGVSYFFAQSDTLESSAQAKAPAGAASETNGTGNITADASALNAATSKQQTNRAVLDAAGYITARRIATVSSEISGRIVELNVEEGMIVERDQVLARLDDAVAQVNLQLEQSRVKALQAEVDSIDVNLAEAKRVLARSLRSLP